MSFLTAQHTFKEVGLFIIKLQNVDRLKGDLRILRLVDLKLVNTRAVEVIVEDLMPC